jgi:twitching motility protein PilU
MGMALAYAQSGHLALATLHANNSYHAMNRIISFYPLENRPTLLLDLSAALQAIVSQRLVRTKTGARRAAVEVILNTPPRLGADREGRHQRDQGRDGKEHGARLADLRAVAVQDVHGRLDHAGRVHGQRGFGTNMLWLINQATAGSISGQVPVLPAATRRTKRRMKGALSNTGTHTSSATSRLTPALELAQELIRRRSVTPEDGGCQENARQAP